MVEHPKNETLRRIGWTQAEAKRRGVLNSYAYLEAVARAIEAVPLPETRMDILSVLVETYRETGSTMTADEHGAVCQALELIAGKLGLDLIGALGVGVRGAAELGGEAVLEVVRG